MKGLLLALLILLLLFPMAYAQVVPDSVGTGVAVTATATSGPTMLEKIASVLQALTPIVSILVGLGLFTKYAPFMKWFPNQLTPFLNALIAFFAIFNVPDPAHSGIFGDLVRALSPVAKAAGSAAIAVGARLVYETFFRGPLEKFGIFKAGIEPEAKAAKIALVQPIGTK